MISCYVVYNPSKGCSVEPTLRLESIDCRRCLNGIVVAELLVQFALVGLTDFRWDQLYDDSVDLRCR